MTAPTVPPDRIESVRRFNRFYTRRIGVLGEGLLDSPFGLTECRVLWELAHADEQHTLTAKQLAETLTIDAGYLSRLLRGLKERGLVRATRAKDDARHLHLQLTAAGRRAFAPIDTRSQHEVRALLAPLSEAQQRRLLHAFDDVRELLEPRPRTSSPPYLLRPHRPGDMGWLIARHGALYAEEYRWDMHFEALVARIAADFIDRFEPRREACWIAEQEGRNVGCVCLVRSRDESTQEVAPGVAQLRLLLVEPEARGLGIGARLVDECTRFARHAGYDRIRLWTNSVLTAARAIYRKAGYELVATEAHHSFGHDLVGETWELALR